MVKIINSLLPFTVEMCTLYPRILFGVLFRHFWSSFVYTVVCLFCNIACGSLIDSNLQNICHIFFKKYYLFAHTRWRRGCRLKVNVHVQRVQRGGARERRSEHMYFMDDPHHHWFSQLHIWLFQADYVFYCRAKRKMCALYFVGKQNYQRKSHSAQYLNYSLKQKYIIIR